MTAARPVALMVSAVILAVSAVLVVTPGEAGAFAEDVCYSARGSKADSCASLPKICPLTEPTSPACRTAALALLTVAAARPGGGRSLVHSDSTYVMARAVGFSSDDAYWIAAYDEATDLGSFSPKGTDGKPVPNSAALTTSDIGGLVRTNFNTGGLLFHFVATFKDQPNQTPDGLHPNPRDAQHEILLTHLRRWAMAGPGSNAPLCTGGFTTPSASGDIATGDTCFGGPNPVPIRGVIAVEAPAAIPFATSTGLQIISGKVRSDQFDSWVGGGQRAADARVGIYLHVLADRISHHRCTDAAQIVIPAHGDERFREDLDNPECDQGLHALRHIYETGVPFAQLDAADRTTEAALPQVYDELVEFARARGVLNLQAVALRPTVIDRGLIPALEYPDAVARITAVAAVACRLGFEPFPGEPACAGQR
ncbi:hypothetical protein FHU31_004085 [Mycolicibacterium fluoranthenivorans]|uniref:Uncharacterized protein n=2 Tax=Mycolicibacterium fluoranthenivorans TaxID=258505 RepID=A0A7X5U2C5_9MYCO|nr:hypothetical protein [Mycolicibacterium fluoranthenivorans]